MLWRRLNCSSEIKSERIPLSLLASYLCYYSVHWVAQIYRSVIFRCFWVIFLRNQSCKVALKHPKLFLMFEILHILLTILPESNRNPNRILLSRHSGPDSLLFKGLLNCFDSWALPRLLLDLKPHFAGHQSTLGRRWQLLESLCNTRLRLFLKLTFEVVYSFSRNIWESTNLWTILLPYLLNIVNVLLMFCIILEEFCIFIKSLCLCAYVHWLCYCLCVFCISNPLIYVLQTDPFALNT